MALSNCAECGKLFAKIRTRICPTCEKAEEERLRQVKEYMRSEKVSSLLQIVDGTGIEHERLMKWVAEGKLELKSSIDAPKIGCKSCGKPLDSGDICNACKNELAKKIGTLRSETGHLDGAVANPERRSGMHMRE